MEFYLCSASEVGLDWGINNNLQVVIDNWGRKDIGLKIVGGF
jgi:hypothetical protein